MSTPLPGRDFTAAPAFRTLRKLAGNAPDLTEPGVLDAARIGALRAEAAGWSLLYATQRVNEAVLKALSALARETAVLQRFEMLLAGEPLNRIEGHESENRRVLHFASRNVVEELPDPHPWPATADAVANARTQLERLRIFLKELEQGEVRAPDGAPFSDLVHVGIGGSDLGPRALYLALQPFLRQGRRVHFISNVDPDDAAQVLRGLNLAHTLVNVVSKSGTTLETRTNETLVRAALKKAGLKPARHMLCVTGAGSPMDDPQHYLRAFHMFDYIGGRYSATSMVGAVPLGFALGYDQMHDLLRGAREMDLAALTPEPRENLPLLAALLGIWNRNFLRLPTLAVLPYSQALIRFAAHLQQLDMESNGKGVTRHGALVDFDTGPIVWGEPGTNGQHAFYQLIHQSPTVVPCEFIGLRQSQYGEDLQVEGTSSQQKLLANLLAQAQALATGQDSANPNRFFPGNRPNSILMADRLTPRTLGALLSFYEAKVAFQGLIWNINSFDQEGVQLGKVLATRLLAHMAGKAPAGGEAQDPIGPALLKAAGLR
ncbi:MAG: glucose-6-phosphate isomerase [Candidatus Lambdaproteobacteria bacterium]|nr:glucose-6-phosphate isomerase [Candidatus Lambdaproteobacteria bacterium]